MHAFPSEQAARQWLASLPPDELEAWLKTLRTTPSLRRWIEETSPRYAPVPAHLYPLINVLERAERGPVRVLVSMPPRHAKTETILHALAWMIERHPERLNAYITYQDKHARSKSRKARRLVLSRGVELANDSASLGDWRTLRGGGLRATGIGGALTGEGINGLLVVDDPFKGRADAESPLAREKVWEWFTDVAYTRLEPGSSCIVVATRWHADDLIGRLETFDTGAAQPWEVINLPALRVPGTYIPSDDLDAEALWPSQYPVDALADIRSTLGPYGWASLYQGHPVPRGGKLFRDAAYYSDPRIPVGASIVVAVDPAGSSSTRADYTAAVVLAVWGQGSRTEAHVLEVVRLQADASTVATELVKLSARRGNARLLVEATRDGIAITSALKKINANLPFHMVPAQGDKFARSQAVAAAWNEGRVRVPEVAGPWRREFLEEVYAFTGIADRHDDQVDALAHAWNYALAQRTGAGVTPPVSSAQPRFSPSQRAWG